MDKYRFFLLLRSFLLAWSLAWGSSLCLAAGIPGEYPQGTLWAGVSLAFTLALGTSGVWLLLIPGALAILAAGGLLPQALPGCLAALGVCRTVCRGKGLWFAVPTALFPLGFCLANPGTAPAPEGLLLLLVGLGVLLLTAHTRFQHPRQGNRLAAAAAPVLAAGLGLILLLNPPESYVNHSAGARDFLTRALPAVGAVGEGALAPITVAPTQVLLRERPRTPSGQMVMTVTAQESGKLYLRERSYDRYDGNTWSAGSEEEVFCAPPGGSREVVIRTRGRRDHLFVGYYPEEGVTLTGGALPNTAGISQYTLHCTALVYPPVTEERPVPEGLSRYLSLPEATRLGTQALVPREGSASEKARAIGARLREGTYTLYPDSPPEGEDFALSFLSGPMEGTCTHFAAAAAVLLRSAGVPARLVGGYLVEAEGGREVTVTEKDAHAWAEFYEPALDAWLILDATPPREIQEETAAPAAQAPRVETRRDLLLPGLVLALFAAELQLWVRRLVGWSVRRKASPNRRALFLWRKIQIFSRLFREPVSRELAALARKACFSAHDLTEGELAVLEAALGQLRRKVQKKFFLSRLVLRWVFGVY